MDFHILCQPSVFMRRRLWEQVGGLDLAYHFLLDHHLWLRVATRAPIHHVDRVWTCARYHAEAKNAAQGEGFAREALRLAAWMAEEPRLAPLYHRLRRQVWVAAYRFSGRYLLDAEHWEPSLVAYLRALVWHSPTALRESHRILIALLGLAGLGGAMRRAYYRRAWSRIPPEARALGIENADHLVMQTPWKS